MPEACAILVRSTSSTGQHERDLPGRRIGHGNSAPGRIDRVHRTPVCARPCNVSGHHVSLQNHFCPDHRRGTPERRRCPQSQAATISSSHSTARGASGSRWQGISLAFRIASLSTSPSPTGPTMMILPGRGCGSSTHSAAQRSQQPHCRNARQKPLPASSTDLSGRYTRPRRRRKPVCLSCMTGKTSGLCRMKAPKSFVC